MRDEERREPPHDHSPHDPPPAMTRDEWIAYLAGRETPAYSGWADNLPEPWRNERPAPPPPAGTEG